MNKIDQICIPGFAFPGTISSAGMYCIRKNRSKIPGAHEALHSKNEALAAEGLLAQSLLIAATTSRKDLAKFPRLSCKS
eukprot:775658-Amphidinium_carterae.1